jgi:hypothetical protein
MGVTTGLRRLWLAGGVVCAVGLLVPGGGGILAVPGLLVTAVAAGCTVARGRSVGGPWLLLAWAVPLIPTLATVGFFLWLAHVRADPLAVVLVVAGLGGLSVLTWAAFVVALLVEVFRTARRRFGDPPPAWENAPTPPSHS